MRTFTGWHRFKRLKLRDEDFDRYIVQRVECKERLREVGLFHRCHPYLDVRRLRYKG